MQYCRKELIYGLIIAFGSFNYGYLMAFPSPAISEFEKKWDVSKLETTSFNAISSFFAAFGALTTTLLLQDMGRRLAFSIISAACAVFWSCLLFTSEKKFWVGIVIRAFLGFSVGSLTSLCPMYLVEIAPTNITGFFGGLSQGGVILGMIIMYLQGNWESWWTLCITGLVTSVLECILIWFVPETNNKFKESAEDDNSEKEEKESIWQKKYAGKLTVGIFLMFFQQFSGIGALITNLNKSFINAGVKMDSGIASAICVTAQLIGVIACEIFVGIIGRKALWTISSCGCSIGLFVFALGFRFKWDDWIPIFVIFMYMFFFGLALGPIPWYTTSELFPDSVRSLGSSIVSMANWISAFVVIFLYPWMVDEVGDLWSHMMFTFVTIIGCFFGIFCIKEPKKKREVSNNNSESST